MTSKSLAAVSFAPLFFRQFTTACAYTTQRNAGLAWCIYTSLTLSLPLPHFFMSWNISQGGSTSNNKKCQYAMFHEQQFNDFAVRLQTRHFDTYAKINQHSMRGFHLLKKHFQEPPSVLCAHLNVSSCNLRLLSWYTSFSEHNASSHHNYSKLVTPLSPSLYLYLTHSPPFSLVYHTIVFFLAFSFDVCRLLRLENDRTHSKSALLRPTSQFKDAWGAHDWGQAGACAGTLTKLA